MLSRQKQLLASSTDNQPVNHMSIDGLVDVMIDVMVLTARQPHYIGNNYPLTGLPKASTFHNSLPP